MKFKEEAQFFPNSRGINYQAIDPLHDGENNQLFRNVELIKENGIEYLIGEYSGLLPLTPFVDLGEYRTRVTFGELKVLFEQQPYSKVYRAAYPQGSKAEDDEALYFFERAKDPVAKDGLIEVTDQLMTDALDHFILQNYMNADDKIRIQLGIKL